MEGKATQARFCSDACRTKAARRRRPVSASCKRCGDPLGDRHGNALFCSQTCSKAFKDAAYYERHRESVRAAQAARRVAAIEAARQRDAAYYLANRDDPVFQAKRSTIGARRRATAADAFVEHVDRSTVWLRDGGICHLCGQAADPSDWHLDHIVPLARGGQHSYTNTAVSHPRCNLSKGARLLP